MHVILRRTRCRLSDRALWLHRRWQCRASGCLHWRRHAKLDLLIRTIASRDLVIGFRGPV